MLIHGTTRAINAIVTGNTARTALPDDRGPSRHPGVPRGRPASTRSTSTSPYPQPYVPARADLRGAGADRSPTARSSRPLDEAAVLAVIEQLPARERRGGRRLPALVDRQPGARAARRRADRRSICPACRSRCRTAQPDRCANTAAPRPTSIDASLKPLMSRYLARARARGCARPASPAACSMRDLAGRRDRCRGRRRGADPSRSIPARRWRRSPAATTRGRRRHRDGRSSPTPAARPTTSAWCAAAAFRGRARPGSARPLSAT